MTAEEQRQIDAEARRAALRSMESMGDIGSRTGAAVAPALPPSGFDENGIGPIDMQPAAEPTTPAPVEAPNRDHLGDIEPSSGSVFGPDFPETEEPAPDPAPTAQRDPAVRDRVMGSSASQPIPGASALADPRPSIVRDRLGPKPPVDAAREAAAGPLPTLDAGLPSEADIAGAREGAGDSFLRHLQNGLRGAIGMPTREAPTTADDLASERRAGIRAGMERKGVLRAAESTAGASADRQSRQDDLAQARLGLQERSVAAQEAQIPSRIAATEAGTARTQAQTESAQLATQFSRATREERQSAESQLSRGYQQAIEATLRGMGPTGARFREGLTGPLDTQSAEQLDPLMRRLQSAGMRTTGAGGGTAGSLDALRSRAVAHGVDAEDAAVLSASDLRREIGEDIGPAARAAHDRAGGGSRVSVWENAEGVPVTASPDAFSTPTEERTYRNALEDAGRISTLLDAIDSAYREAGGGASLGSRTQAATVLTANGAIQQPIGSMLGAISDYLTHTGVVNPGGEAERLMGMLPNPTSTRQILTGSYDAQAAQFRGTIADMVRRDARQRGVTDEDTARLLREIGLGSHTAGAHARRSASPAAPAAPAPSPTGDDFSQMSDEELRAIAGGG